VLVAESPLGPFRPFHNHAHTPTDVMALDGTLWVEKGVPYMVYCHEWVQIEDGAVELVRLKPDLSAIDGDAVTLFKGSDAPWTFPGRDRYVTDGPFLYRTQAGKLLMLWSTFGWRGYMTLVAASESGSVHGPWVQQPRPLFTQDGGHAMVFTRFDGTPMVVLHHSNRSPNERALPFALEDDGETLAIVRTLPTDHPFADPDLPLEARVDDLLSRMTVDEKTACLGTEPDVPRLGVWGTGHVEGLHGLAMGGPPGNWGRPSPVPTTQFPQAIGLGETWDPDLVRQAAAIEGYETRYLVQSKRFRRGGLVVRAPNADLGRDIRVLGPRADQVLLDWYSGDPPYTVTALAGIRNKVGDRVRVTYARGDEAGAAVALAQEAGVAIVCVGNHPTGDAGWAQCPTPSDGKEAVDRRAITLEQEELIKQVYRVNPNTIVVLISSFPFAIPWTQRHVPAIVHLTHNSQELGNAPADGWCRRGHTASSNCRRAWITTCARGVRTCISRGNRFTRSALG
jgi:hypothetical protein